MDATTEGLVSAAGEWFVEYDNRYLITDQSPYEDVYATTASMNISINTLNPEYYSPAYRAVGTVLVGVIFVVGIVGNVLVVAVVTRTRSMHTPTNWYLVSLAVADILLLVSAPLPTLIEYHLLVDQWVLGRPGCSAVVFVQYLGVNVSSLSITAFTIERYMAICHPMNVQTTNTVRRARWVIVGLWAAGTAYCSPWLFLATTVPRHLIDGRTFSACTFTLKRDKYLVYYMADLIIFYVVPLLTACVLYGLIARTLYSVSGPTRSCSSSVRSNVGAVVGTPAAKVGGVYVPAGTCGGSVGGRWRKSTFLRQQSSVSMMSAHGSNSNSRLQVVKMLAVVVAMFATLWLPYRSYVVYNSFARQRFEDRWFMLFCRMAIYANSAVNPILYNAMSGRFRSAFRDQLSCCFSCCGTGRPSLAIQMAINNAAYVNARVAVDIPPSSCTGVVLPATRRVVMETPSERDNRVADDERQRNGDIMDSHHRSRFDDVIGIDGRSGVRPPCERYSLLVASQDGGDAQHRCYYATGLETI